jgi:hypothetical protein
MDEKVCHVNRNDHVDRQPVGQGRHVDWKDNHVDVQSHDKYGLGIHLDGTAIM